MKKAIVFLLLHVCSLSLFAQINTDKVLSIGRNALYFEDYVLSIQYFNQVIKSKPWLAEPYFYRAIAKVNLDDFKGAEEDCSSCLERNPFLVQAYFCRGIARQSQAKYAEAIADYRKGLEFKSEDRQMLLNEAIANIQLKNFDEAEKTYEKLISLHPKYTLAYLTRGAMFLEKGDSVSAMNDYNKVIELDPYYSQVYAQRALLYYQTKELDKALNDLNEAIRLEPRQIGYHINRGAIRYEMNDLRGAMTDYDLAVTLNGQDLIARFNRGLLRFQVGDNNRAIDDFDVVIQLEPDNFMAYYNRALLKTEIGDYVASVKDFDVVIKHYPAFLPGYYSRAEAKKKMGDLKGADRDIWTAFELEQNAKKNKNSDKAETSDNQSGEASVNKSDGKTREQSDRNIDKFNRLVVFDKEEERKNKYNSDVRGRVQDRTVRVDLEPQFIITYYEKPDQIKTFVYYDKMIEAFNNRMLLTRKLRITNQEAALIEEQIAAHFASIDEFSSKIAVHPEDAGLYFGKAMDFTLVQDFSEAIKDYTRAIEQDPSFAMAYFNRAVVRYKQMEYNMSNQSVEPDGVSTMSLDLFVGKKLSGQQNSAVAGALKDNKKTYDYEMIVRDYDMVIKLNPDFIYAYFNRGNLRCALRDYRAAISDYSEAIKRDSEFAEAYFNRGLTRLQMGDMERGIEDLSKAGELGVINAYSIIKRMTVD